jgi:hypothetical protein
LLLLFFLVSSLFGFHLTLVFSSSSSSSSSSLAALAYNIPLDSNIIAVLSTMGTFNKIFSYLFSLMVLMTSIPVFLVISQMNLVQNFDMNRCKFIPSRSFITFTFPLIFFFFFFFFDLPHKKRPTHTSSSPFHFYSTKTKDVSIGLCYLLPWLVSIPFLTGLWLFKLNIWTSLIFVSTANFIVPLCIYLKAVEFRKRYNARRELSDNQRRLLRVIHAQSVEIREHFGDHDRYFGVGHAVPLHGHGHGLHIGGGGSASEKESRIEKVGKGVEFLVAKDGKEGEGVYGAEGGVSHLKQMKKHKKHKKHKKKTMLGLGLGSSTTSTKLDADNEKQLTAATQMQVPTLVIEEVESVVDIDVDGLDESRKGDGDIVLYHPKPVRGPGARPGGQNNHTDVENFLKVLNGAPASAPSSPNPSVGQLGPTNRPLPPPLLVIESPEGEEHPQFENVANPNSSAFLTVLTNSRTSSTSTSNGFTSSSPSASPLYAPSSPRSPYNTWALSGASGGASGSSLTPLSLSPYPTGTSPSPSVVSSDGRSNVLSSGEEAANKPVASSSNMFLSPFYNTNSNPEHRSKPSSCAPSFTSAVSGHSCASGVSKVSGVTGVTGVSGVSKRSTISAGVSSFFSGFGLKSRRPSETTTSSHSSFLGGGSGGASHAGNGHVSSSILGNNGGDRKMVSLLVPVDLNALGLNFNFNSAGGTRVGQSHSGTGEIPVFYVESPSTPSTLSVPMIHSPSPMHPSVAGGESSTEQTPPTKRKKKSQSPSRLNSLGLNLQIPTIPFISSLSSSPNGSNSIYLSSASSNGVDFTSARAELVTLDDVSSPAVAVGGLPPAVLTVQADPELEKYLFEDVPDPEKEIEEEEHQKQQENMHAQQQQRRYSHHHGTPKKRLGSGLSLSGVWGRFGGGGGRGGADAGSGGNESQNSQAGGGGGNNPVTGGWSQMMRVPLLKISTPTTLEEEQAEESSRSRLGLLGNSPTVGSADADHQQPWLVSSKGGSGTDDASGMYCASPNGSDNFSALGIHEEPMPSGLSSSNPCLPLVGLGLGRSLSHPSSNSAGFGEEMVEIRRDEKNNLSLVLSPQKSHDGPQEVVVVVSDEGGDVMEESGQFLTSSGTASGSMEQMGMSALGSLINTKVPMIGASQSTSLSVPTLSPGAPYTPSEGPSSPNILPKLGLTIPSSPASFAHRGASPQGEDKPTDGGLFLTVPPVTFPGHHKHSHSHSQSGSSFSSSGPSAGSSSTSGSHSPSFRSSSSRMHSPIESSEPQYHFHDVGVHAPAFNESGQVAPVGSRANSLSISTNATMTASTTLTQRSLAKRQTMEKETDHMDTFPHTSASSIMSSTGINPSLMTLRSSLQVPPLSDRQRRPSTPPLNPDFVRIAQQLPAFRSVPRWVPVSPRMLAYWCLTITCIATISNLVYVLLGYAVGIQ